ncbi:MAG: helix-turn-helix transcriptional regulator [Solirubrobacteraceae bacterium]
MAEPTVRDLEAFGRRVRDRRQELGLSLRALAARAGVSPAYVTSIERGHNPSTGRPPVPSIHVVANLAAELGLDVSGLVRGMGVSDPTLPDDHVLLYCLDMPPAGLLDLLDRRFGAEVDHWVYVADPREGDAEDLDGRATIVRWELGTFPYETRHLDPADLVAALEETVRAVAPAQSGRRVGLAIADCSAVMRWVQNAASEVALEETWHDHVHRIWAQHLGGPPAIDVCAYRHDDLQALGLTIDQIATALALIRDHHRVLVVDDDDVVTGFPAIRRILQRVQPPGVSASAWSDLTSAAAEALAARAVA